MLFVKPAETARVTCWVPTIQNSPELTIVAHDGTVLERMYMDYAEDNLYSTVFQVPDYPTFLACLVNGAGKGSIMVGMPSVMKIFYYAPSPGSTRYTFYDPDTQQVLTEGEMFPIGHDLYVITTTLDGDVHLVAGNNRAAPLMLPFRPHSAPLNTLHVRAAYSASTEAEWEMS